MADRRPPPRPGNNPPRRGPRPGGPARRPQGRRPFTPDAHSPAPALTPAPRRNAPRGGEGGGDAGGPDRLQKVLAHAGVGSRRACEDLILQGRVTIDGQTVRELGTKVDPRTQQVALDGQRIHSERNVYYAVHKPKGYVATNSDPAGKPRVIDLLPEIPQRAYAVGRLDEQSTGLMLLTNDGELANKLAHPKFGVEKVYRVVVAGEPARDVLEKLTQGIWLAEGKVRAKRVKLVGRKGHASVMEMVLAEGKNREIRRMLAKLGHKVMSLTRIAVGPIGLKGLGVGECRPLTGQEVDMLRKVAAGMFLQAPRYPDRRERIPRQTGPKRSARPTGPAGHHTEDGGRHQSDRPRRPAAGSRPEQDGRPVQAYRPPQGDHPRPEGRREAGGPPPRSNGPRPSGQGAPPHRPSGPGPRPAYGPGPAQGYGQGQGQGQNRGPARRPSPPAPTGPPPLRIKRASGPDPDVPTRKIIGMEPEPGQGPRQGQGQGQGRGRPPGPPGPRRPRPVPKRSPRAALGVKRPPRDEETGGE